MFLLQENKSCGKKKMFCHFIKRNFLAVRKKKSEWISLISGIQIFSKVLPLARYLPRSPYSRPRSSEENSAAAYLSEAVGRLLFIVTRFVCVRCHSRAFVTSLQFEMCQLETSRGSPGGICIGSSRLCLPHRSVFLPLNSISERIHLVPPPDTHFHSGLRIQPSPLKADSVQDGGLADNPASFCASMNI